MSVHNEKVQESSDKSSQKTGYLSLNWLFVIAPCPSLIFFCYNFNLQFYLHVALMFQLQHDSACPLDDREGESSPPGILHHPYKIDHVLCDCVAKEPVLLYS